MDLQATSKCLYLIKGDLDYWNCNSVIPKEVFLCCFHLCSQIYSENVRFCAKNFAEWSAKWLKLL